jgi:L-serine dehydratase
MIGPSSSHTAGVVRIGRVARRVLGEQPVSAVITFYNSFAATYEGHGSDRAILGGLLDFRTDDARIREAKQHAEAAGLQWKFRAVGSASKYHPNSVRLQLTGASGYLVELLGVSRGGGLISIVEIDGLNTNFTAQAHTLIIDAGDRTGSIAFISSVVANEDCNIGTMTVARNAKNGLAKLVLEMDSGVRPLTVDYLNSLSWVHRVRYIPDIDL